MYHDSSSEERSRRSRQSATAEARRRSPAPPPPRTPPPQMGNDEMMDATPLIASSVSRSVEISPAETLPPSSLAFTAGGGAGAGHRLGGCALVGGSRDEALAAAASSRESTRRS